MYNRKSGTGLAETPGRGAPSVEASGLRRQWSASHLRSLELEQSELEGLVCRCLRSYDLLLTLLFQMNMIPVTERNARHEKTSVTRPSKESVHANK